MKQCTLGNFLKRISIEKVGKSRWLLAIQFFNNFSLIWDKYSDQKNRCVCLKGKQKEQNWPEKKYCRKKHGWGEFVIFLIPFWAYSSAFLIWAEFLSKIKYGWNWQQVHISYLASHLGLDVGTISRQSSDSNQTDHCAKFCPKLMPLFGLGDTALINQLICEGNQKALFSFFQIFRSGKKCCKNVCKNSDRKRICLWLWWIICHLEKS